MSYDKLLKVKELAEQLRISVATAYDLIRVGKIVAIRVGSRKGILRIRESEVSRYLEESTIALASFETSPELHSIRLKHITLKPR